MVRISTFDYDFSTELILGKRASLIGIGPQDETRNTHLRGYSLESNTLEHIFTATAQRWNNLLRISHPKKLAPSHAAALQSQITNPNELSNDICTQFIVWDMHSHLTPVYQQRSNFLHQNLPLKGHIKSSRL